MATTTPRIAVQSWTAAMGNLAACLHLGIATHEEDTEKSEKQRMVLVNGTLYCLWQAHPGATTDRVWLETVAMAGFVAHGDGYFIHP